MDLVPDPSDTTGASDALNALRSEIELVARTPLEVLLTGEPGSSSEPIARLLHDLSSRRLAPFLAVNCAGVPGTILESELFGYTRGSFTGAYRDKRGLLKIVDGGTILLDEIGQLTPALQERLLRFLETGRLQQLGASVLERIDVRVIAATNTDLVSQIAAGTLRADLFYRLSRVRLHLPPMRDREPERAPADPALHLLQRYAWPDNARQLHAIVEWGSLSA